MNEYSFRVCNVQYSSTIGLVRRGIKALMLEKMQRICFFFFWSTSSGGSLSLISNRIG